MYLPFELVNVNGGQPTNSYYNIEEQSSIQQEIFNSDIEIEIPSKADYNAWSKFIKWLYLQDIVTTFDFNIKYQQLWRTNEN